MKVFELIEMLKTLEPDWEVCHQTEYEPFEEISHINVNEKLKTYSLY